MENPLEQPAPEDMIERVQVLARDLAYGVVNEYWKDIFAVRNSRAEDGGAIYEWLLQVLDDKYNYFHQQFMNKWDGKFPHVRFLSKYGFVHGYRSDGYELTAYALQLLSQPVAIPSVFISYAHRQSSALSLLIEARLRLADNNIGVFIDKSIPAGDDWHPHLEERVKECQYFICLIGPETLNSPYVKQEIKWAFDSNGTVISICHNGFRFSGEATDELIEKLSRKQAIVVDLESGKHYEAAVNELLNRLGYATY